MPLRGLQAWPHRLWQAVGNGADHGKALLIQPQADIHQGGDQYGQHRARFSQEGTEPARQGGAFEWAGHFLRDDQAGNGQGAHGHGDPVYFPKTGQQTAPQFENVLATGVDAEQVAELACGNNDGTAADKPQDHRMAEQIGEPAHAQGGHYQQDGPGQ